MARAAAARAVPARQPRPATRRRPATRPATRPAPRTAPRRRSSTGQMRAVVVSAPMGLMDRLLRGRLWIGLVFALLAGIVFLNVTLLQVNREITTLTTEAADLNRENSALRDKIAKEAAPEQIQTLAVSAGFKLPAPDEVLYLTADPANDARLAAQALQGGDVVATGEPAVPAESAGDIEPVANVTSSPEDPG